MFYAPSGGGAQTDSIRYMKSMAAVAPEQPATTSMMTAIIPDGIMPGSVFHISTPSGSLMAVTCPPTSKPGDQIQIAVSAGPVGTPALQLAIEKEDLVRIGKVTNASFSTGYQAEIPVTGGSGTEIGVLRLHTTNVVELPCTVQLISPSGETLMSYEMASLVGRRAADPVIPVQLSGRVYASFTNSIRQVNCIFAESTISVTRVDGSGGTLVGPLQQGCGSARGNLMILGILLWVVAIGMFFLCAAYAMPVTGRVRSLDGTAEYAPYGDARGIKTVNFVPNPKDKKRDSYKTCDAKTKVDALVGIMVSAVSDALNATYDRYIDDHGNILQP